MNKEFNGETKVPIGSIYNPIAVVAAIIERGSQILLLRRGPSISGSGEWEFPGGKILKDETDESALRREIFEELKIEIIVISHFQTVLFTKQNSSNIPTTIELKAYNCSLSSSCDITFIDHDALMWISPLDIPIHMLSIADQDIATNLKAKHTIGAPPL